MPLRLLCLASVLVLSAASAAAQTPQRGRTAEDIAIRDAIREYQETGVARVVEVGQTILAPYNQIDPVLKTALLRTTLVELDDNEFVVDRFIGDSLRWSVDFGVTGTENNFRQIISIKPRDQDITTSLVLTTNTGRIYQFTLDSEPYPINRNQNPVGIPYTAHVRFYYPDDGLPPDPREAAQTAEESLLWSTLGLSPGDFAGDGYGGRLNRDYIVNTDAGFPCEPTFVGDDGIRLIVRFPDTSEDPFCSTRFPLYDVSESGALQLLNYSVFGGNTYVTDRLPIEARIQYLTEEGDRREVRIRSRAGLTRRPRRPIGLMLDGRVAALFPILKTEFRDAYDTGVEGGGSIGFAASRALTLAIQARFGSIPTDNAFVGGAIGDALTATLVPAIEGRLRAAGAIGAGERVALFSQAGGGDLSTLRVSLAARLSFSPGARVQPYFTARVGLLHRTGDPVGIAATGLIVGADGVARPNAALDAEIAGSFAGAAAGTDAAQADPAYQAFVSRLGGAFGQDRVLPTWLVGESESETAPEVAAGLGLAVRVAGPISVFTEGEFAYTPLGSRVDRAVLPFTFGLRADI